jgi:hypothetical protein
MTKIECPSEAWDRYYAAQEEPENPDEGYEVPYDVDEAEYIGDEQDGCYVQAGQGPSDKWYVTVVVDSETGSFIDTILDTDGPHETEAAAMECGRDWAFKWCCDNGVNIDDSAAPETLLIQK